MKKYLMILAIAPLAFGCNQKKVDDLQNQVNTLSQENADYKKGIDDRDQQLGDYLSTFDAVQTNLNEIKSKENIVTSNLSNETTNKKDDMLASINALNDLIQKNKSLVADLDKKYKNANFKIKELDKMIASLNDQITQKETDLLALKAELEKSNYQVASLTTELNTVSTAKSELQAQNADQANTIAQQTESLNTAYYITGTYKELKEKGVVNKEGGFIGLGKTKDLAENFNASAFTKIDITKFNELPLHSKSAKVITDHLTGSYKLVEGDKEIEELVIDNPSEFWKSSKYLVVLTD